MIILYDVPIPGHLVLIGCAVIGLLIGLFAPARDGRRVANED